MYVWQWQRTIDVTQEVEEGRVTGSHLKAQILLHLVLLQVQVTLEDARVRRK